MAKKEFQKPKNFKKTMKELMVYLKPYVPLIIISLIASIVATILQIIGPDKLKLITNEISAGLPQMVDGKPIVKAIDMEAVKSISLTLLIFYLASLILNTAQSFIMADVTKTYQKALEKKYLKR